MKPTFLDNSAYGRKVNVRENFVNIQRLSFVIDVDGRFTATWFKARFLAALNGLFCGPDQQDLQQEEVQIPNGDCQHGRQGLPQENRLNHRQGHLEHYLFQHSCADP